MSRPAPRKRRPCRARAPLRTSAVLAASCLLVARLALAGPAPKAKAPPKPAPDTLPPSLAHAPVAAAVEGEPLRFEARISDPSGILAPTVLWRIAGQREWASVPLEPAGKDAYTATLPADAVKGAIEYYVEAYDNQGNGPARAGDPTNPLTVPLEEEAAPSAPPPPPPPAPARTGPLLAPARYVPVAVAGVGLALLVSGLVAYADAAATADALNARYAAGTGLTTSDHAVARAASGQGLLGSSLALAGGLTLAGGLGWYLVPTFAGVGGSGGDGLQAGLRSQF